MKKIILILLLLTLVATGAFAQVFSAGGGALFDASFYNGIRIRDGGESFYMGLESFSPGGFVFFDAEFVQAQVSLVHGWHRFVTNFTESGSVERESLGRTLAFGFSVLGKFPFGLGPDITVFPLLGVHYDLVFNAISGEVTYDDVTITNFSQFGLLAGAGTDIYLTDRLFIRAEALFHFRFPSSELRDLRREIGSWAPDISARNTFGMGPRINIGIGYRLDFAWW